MADTNSTLLGIGSLIQGVSSISSAYAQSRFYEAQGAYQAHVAEINSEFSKLAAEEAIKRGQKNIALAQKQKKQVLGSQKVALAAQGIDIESGSALLAQEDTLNTGARNLLQIKNNAWQEAWGYKTQALSSTASGQITQVLAEAQAKNTLLTGGLNAASDFSKSYGYFKGGNISVKGTTGGKPS